MSPQMEEVITTSTITSTETTGSHMLKINGYKTIRNSHCVSEYIESARFNAAGHTWSILFYPHGKTNKDIFDTTSYVSLKLHDGADIARDDTVHANVKFSMVGSWLPFFVWFKTSFRKGNMEAGHGFICWEDLLLTGCIKNRREGRRARSGGRAG
uniref:MATH domain-containing protein n=1 Tax=Leersia perrieri TaxID=77586 RepID=A0A0D9XUD8_9ORYZ